MDYSFIELVREASLPLETDLIHHRLFREIRVAVLSDVPSKHIKSLIQHALSPGRTAIDNVDEMFVQGAACILDGSNTVNKVNHHLRCGNPECYLTHSDINEERAEK